jgi:hypothetical protein
MGYAIYSGVLVSWRLGGTYCLLGLHVDPDYEDSTSVETVVNFYQNTGYRIPEGL